MDNKLRNLKNFFLPNFRVNIFQFVLQIAQLTFANGGKKELLWQGLSTPKIIVQLVWAARLLGNFLHSEVKNLQIF